MTQLVYERVHQRLAQLSLTTIEAVLDNTLQAATAAEKPFLEFLDELLEQEAQARWSRRVDSLRKMSGLPVAKSLDEFDWAFQPSIDKRVLDELRTLRFVHNHENVVFLGPPGVGKTHLALGLGVDALRNAIQTYYTTALDLVEALKGAHRRDTLPQKLRQFATPRLLIIDEIGYLPVDRDGVHLFFQLVNQRYEHASTIFTSNKGFGEWGDVFGDSVLAGALLDRILHHATVVNIKGDSYRMKSRRRTGSVVQNPETRTVEVNVKG